MKRLMVLGAGEFQVPVIKKAKELGYEVLATDYNENAVGLKEADIPLIIDTLDLQGNLHVAKQYNIDGILTTSDYPVRTLAYISKHMGIVGLSEEAARISTNKYELRKKLYENNIPCPMFWSINTLEELEEMKEKLNLPVVLKPVDSSASRGVIKIDSIDDIIEAYKDAIKYSKSNAVIIEEFLDGNEFSIECLIQNNETNIVAITEKTVAGSPYFVETRHVIPALLTINQKYAIEEMVKKAVSVIGLNNSAAHIELKLTSEGPRIIEVGARLGGDYITSDLVPLATGIDMLENIILISLGEKININRSFLMNSAIQFVTFENYNRIIKNINYLTSSKDIVRWEIEERTVNNLKSSFDRLGYFIMKKSNREELMERLSLLTDKA